MTITPIALDIAAELAQRERWHAESREQRVSAAQSLIKSCFPPTELRLVNVLVPYITFEGETRFRKVKTWREVSV